jgi:Tol biopolymer transport system component
VLDFGLAKLTRLPPNFEETGMTDGTEPGMVMGTVGYMSPEQLRGQGVDGRTDLFAFGAILYEMLAGRRAFEKPTSAETMAAILNEEPPAISELAPNTPPALVRIVKRCLEKDPEQRFQSASDLAFALEALSESSGAMTSAGVKHHPPRRVWAPTVLSMALIIVALVLWKMVFRPQRAPRVLSFAKLTNDSQPKFGPMVTDGSRIYFNEGTPGGGHVLIHQVSVKGGEVTTLPLPLNAPEVVDLSRDATELLVANYEVLGKGNSYWVEPVAGGAPRQVGTVRGQAASFGADGTSLIYDNGTGYIVTTALYSASRDASEPRKLLATDGHASGFRFSPDGSRLRFTLENEVATTVMEAASNGTGLVKMFDGCCGEWTPDGRFFTFQKSLDGRSNIWALPDRRRLWRTPRDRPTPLTAGPLDFQYPLPSKEGRQIFAIATSQRGEVVRYDARSGDFVPYLPGISAEALAFSPDGKWVTYTSYPEGTLWRSKVDGTERLQLTFPPMQAFLPRWSPDRKEIVFSARLPDTVWNIYLISSEGGTPERLPSERHQMDANWSPDGNSLVFAIEDDPNAPIYTMDLRTKRISALPGSNGLYSSHWSPDGRFIAALTDGSYALTIFDFTTQEWTEAFPSQVAYETFSHDGKYIYFMNNPAPDLKPRVLRLRMSDRKIEEVVDLQKAGPLLNGRFSTWFGLAPDDSPLVTRDISTQEIYALDMDWP